MGHPIIMVEILMLNAACSCCESSLLHFPASPISLRTSTLLTPSSLIIVLASSSHTRPFHLVSPGSRMLNIAMYSRHRSDFRFKSFFDIESNLEQAIIDEVGLENVKIHLCVEQLPYININILLICMAM